MTEQEQRPPESPLQSDRGVTNISSTVVSALAGMSAQEVEGVHMGGGAARSAGGIVGSITGSGGQTRGVSVEVGTFETAIDLKMGIDYGKNILGTVGEVRQKITERIQNLTGLKVTELNVTIADIIYPENGDAPARTPARTGPEFDTRAASRRELSSGDREARRERPSQIREREEPATPVEPRSQSRTEGSSGPEEVRAEGTPVDEDETRRLRIEDDRGEEASRADETSHEGAEAESAETSGSEAPTDETTLTGGTSSGERAARETASSEEPADDDRTREIERERASEPESRRSRRQRRQRRDEDG